MVSDITIRWLPLGHVAHGYRRVFIVENEGNLSAVIAFSLMPYEAVYQVKDLAPEQNVADPSLWWGLSLVVNMLSDPSAFETADDHYISMRPGPVSAEVMIPVTKYEEANKQGYLRISIS